MSKIRCSWCLHPLTNVQDCPTDIEYPDTTVFFCDDHHKALWNGKVVVHLEIMGVDVDRITAAVNALGGMVVAVDGRTTR